MVVNNWHVVMQAHVAVVGRAARVYFFVYYLVTVVVVSNIVIAFILDGAAGAVLLPFPLAHDALSPSHILTARRIGCPAHSLSSAVRQPLLRQNWRPLIPPLHLHGRAA